MVIVQFPSWEEFSYFLKNERHVTPTSSMKTCYNYISQYFKDNDLNKRSFAKMTHELRSGIAKGKTKPLSSNSVNNYIKLVKHIDYYFELNMFQNFKQAPEQEAEKQKIIMTDEQMKDIAECYIPNAWMGKGTEEDHEHYHRFKTMFHLMRFSGMPRDDIRHLKWSDHYGTHLKVYRKKTKKKRIVPLPEIIRPFFDKLKKYPHGYVFGTKRGMLGRSAINDELKRRVKKLEYDSRISSHCFRYSFDTLTAIYGGEANLSKMAKISGHSLQTAQKYYIQYDIESLVDALEASHPGLRGTQNIDNIKRVILEFAKKLIDKSKFEVYIKITPKEDDSRELHLS